MTRLALLVAALAACHPSPRAAADEDDRPLADSSAAEPAVAVQPRPVTVELGAPTLPPSLETPTLSESPHFAIAEVYGASLYTEVCAWQDLPKVGKELAQYLHAWCTTASGHREEGLEELADLVGARTPHLDAAVRADLVHLAAMTLTAGDAEILLRRHGAADPPALTELAELYRALGRADSAVTLLRDVPTTSLHDVCVRDARILLAGDADAQEAEAYTRELAQWVKYDRECRELADIARCPYLHSQGQATWATEGDLASLVGETERSCTAAYPNQDVAARVLADQWPADTAHAQRWFDYVGAIIAMSPRSSLLAVTALENALLRAGCGDEQITPIAGRAETVARRLEPDADKTLRIRLDRLRTMTGDGCRELRAAFQKR